LGWFFFRNYIHTPTKNWWITLAAVVVLTAIFDNIMIAAGLFEYDSRFLLGIYIGLAPIEDFFYAVLACLLIPAAWSRFSASETHQKQGTK
jgi:lycopene cyclase domain-containing protein